MSTSRPVAKRHVDAMIRVFTFIAYSVLTIVTAQAQSLDADTRTRNALSDIARAQRDQAEALRLIERHQREQARLDRQDRQNAERDSRSMRRSDR